GSLGLRQLDVAETSGAPLLAWDDLRAEGLALDLGARTVSIETITLAKPRVEAHRDATQLNWQRVATGFARLGEDASGDRQPGVPAASSEAAGQASTGKAQADQAPTDQAPADQAPADQAPAGEGAQAQAAPPQAAPEPSRNTWQITLGAFRLEAGVVLLRDEPSGLDYPIDGLSAEVDQIAWPPTPDQPMQARLSMDNSLDGGTLRAQA